MKSSTSKLLPISWLIRVQSSRVTPFALSIYSRRTHPLGSRRYSISVNSIPSFERIGSAIADTRSIISCDIVPLASGQPPFKKKAGEQPAFSADSIMIIKDTTFHLQMQGNFFPRRNHSVSGGFGDLAGIVEELHSTTFLGIYRDKIVLTRLNEAATKVAHNINVHFIRFCLPVSRYSCRNDYFSPYN